MIREDCFLLATNPIPPTHFYPNPEPKRTMFPFFQIALGSALRRASYFTLSSFDFLGEMDSDLQFQVHFERSISFRSSGLVQPKVPYSLSLFECRCAAGDRSKRCTKSWGLRLLDILFFLFYEYFDFRPLIRQEVPPHLSLTNSTQCLHSLLETVGLWILSCFGNAQATANPTPRSRIEFWGRFISIIVW